MRLSQFLLLVTLTCIACNSIVASSKGLIQVKTLDATSQRELTDGTRRKLRGGVNNDVNDDGGERIVSFEGVSEGQGNKVADIANRMGTKSFNVAKDIDKVKKTTFLQKIKDFFANLKRYILKHLRIRDKPKSTEPPHSSSVKTDKLEKSQSTEETNKKEQNGNSPNQPKPFIETTEDKVKSTTETLPHSGDSTHDVTSLRTTSGVVTPSEPEKALSRKSSLNDGGREQVSAITLKSNSDVVEGDSLKTNREVAVTKRGEGAHNPENAATASPVKKVVTTGEGPISEVHGDDLVFSPRNGNINVVANSEVKAKGGNGANSNSEAKPKVENGANSEVKATSVNVANANSEAKPKFENVEAENEVKAGGENGANAIVEVKPKTVTEFVPNRS